MFTHRYVSFALNRCLAIDELVVVIDSTDITSVGCLSWVRSDMKIISKLYIWGF